METPEHLPQTLIAVAALVAVSVLVLSTARVPAPWAPLTAIARAAAQLALLSVVLAGVITSPVWIAVALAVMFAAASLVAAKRSGSMLRDAPAMATSMGAGVLIACSIVFIAGALEFSPRYVLALCAIVIGNAMSVATLTARGFRRVAVDRWDEVEGWLALGATPRQSTLELARRSVYEALIPSVDQAKTTGLVVLPGAFVGAIFGGLSPIEAGRFQLIVLASLLAASTLTAVAVALWHGSMRTKPAAPGR